jgi:hypothetical protein
MATFRQIADELAAASSLLQCVALLVACWALTFLLGIDASRWSVALGGGAN